MTSQPPPTQPPLPPQGPPPGYWQAADGNWYPPQPYAQPPKKKHTLRNVILGIIGFFVIVFLLAAACSGPDSSSSAGSKKSAQDQAPAIEVDVATIVKEYEGNEVQADAKYSGKLVRVTGNVHGVDAEFLDDDAYTLTLDDGSDFPVINVTCYGIPKSDLANVAIDTTVTMTGTVGDGGGLSVRLDDCVLG